MLKKLKFCIAAIFAVCLFSAGTTAFASPICPVPTEVTQPDGTVITVTAYGDEFFSWKEDENGNVIAYDEETGSYKYAEIEDGKLVPTSETVGNTSLLRCVPQRLQREDIMPLWENAERADYTQPDENGRIALLTADEEPEQEKPLTHQKLLTLLIEFNDVKLKYDGAFWAKQMYSTNPKDISVVNYWRENSNGLDVFKPADTSNVQDGASGTVSYEDYTNIGYTITKCPEGVVKVSLDMPHPIKTWNNQSGDIACDTVVLAFRAVESYFNFPEDKLHLITVFAGYDAAFGYGDGKGQVSAFASMGGLSTSDGIPVCRVAVQGERMYDDLPVGIGVACHELGHSVFGLPDLYFNNVIGATPECGVCSYSLMSSGCHGFRYNPYRPDDPPTKISELPSHLDAWCKIQCGFVTPTLINEWDGNLNSISENGIYSKYNVLEIRSKSAPNQYFLIENRQLIGYDRGLEETNHNYVGDEPICGGIIIWHIDENVSESNNGTQIKHPFMQAERSTNEWSPAKWAYTGEQGRNTFNGETTPNSNLYQLKTWGGNWSCSAWEDCHPQTLKSGITIEVLSENGPSMRVKANVDEEYRVTMVEGAKFSEIFPDPNFCGAVIDILQEEDEITRKSDDVMSIRDWAMISGISELQIEGFGIKDLTGIEYFLMLEVLNCSYNELTELDPTQFPNLILLACDSNRLTEVDVSQCPNLLYFYCDNNLLTEIDVSNNKELGDFTCSNNQLTYLDISQNHELYWLECNNNRLTTLDVTNNPYLEILWCCENYMDAETPGNSIRGLELLPELGSPLWMDEQGENRFVYYPQNIPDAEHNWDSAWQKDDTHHWHNCTDADCPIVNNADKGGYSIHTWDSGDVTTQPTCTDVGIKTYTCSVCGATKTEELAATGHTAVTDPAKAPTCTESGLTAGSHCSVCGTVLVGQETVPAIGHTAGEWETVTSATTEQDGLRVKKCTVCHAELERETIPKLKPASPGPSTPGPAPEETNPPDNDPANCLKDENCPLRRYTDINVAAWYHTGIHYCITNGLMNGEGNGKFAPNAVLTRGMLAQILYNNAGRPAVTGNNPFDDVESGAWYANAVAWAAESGIVSGYGNGRFGPNDPITREQLAVMLYRHAGSPASPDLLLPFDDAEDVSDYALDALRWAVEKDILNGKGNGILDPKGRATRAEVAAMLQRYLTLEGYLKQHRASKFPN